MLNWLTQNLPTILVALVLLAICALIILKMVLDKKKGKSSCGCGCSGCAMSSMCHQQNTAHPEQKTIAKQQENHRQ